MTANQDTPVGQEQAVRGHLPPLPRAGDRPVHCRLCGQKMFYAGDPRCESEVRVEIFQTRRPVGEFYAHAACWMELMESSNCAENPDVLRPCQKCGGVGTIEIQTGEEDDPCSELHTCDECKGTGELANLEEDVP